MKVIAWFKPDGEHEESFYSVDIPDTEHAASPMQAIAFAKDILRDKGQDLSMVERYEVEEDLYEVASLVSGEPAAHKEGQ